MRINGINIAELDKKFIIETPSYSNNSVTNERVKSWTTYSTVWGKWLQNSNERFEADQSVAVNDGRIVIRWLSGLQETMRINDGGVYHYIKGVDLTDRNVTMTLKTERRDNV